MSQGWIGQSEEGYVTLTWIAGTAEVKIRLYGPVSDERLEREQRICRHRAEQLNQARRRAYIPKPINGDVWD